MLYKLKKGVSLEEYIDFSKNIDQPLVKSYKPVIDFAINYVAGPEKIWDLFEVIKVESWEEWEEITKTEKMKKHDIEWKKYIDADSVKIIYGDRISI